MAGKHLRLHREYLKVAIRTAMEYKASFIMQVITMCLNDLVFLIFWMLFFNRFSTVEGWNMNDILMLYSVITIVYGLTGVLFGNRGRIASTIAEGRLDYYLTLPKNILYHLMISRTSWYDLGDIIFGVILAALFIPLAKIPLLILLAVMGTIIFASFMILVGSMAFYIGNSQSLENMMQNTIVGLASYPLSIFKGFAKFIVLILIPAGFITGVPVQLIKDFNMEWFLMMAGFTILIFLLSITIFYRGLKKYESGNLLYVRS